MAFQSFCQLQRLSTFPQRLIGITQEPQRPAGIGMEINGVNSVVRRCEGDASGP